MALVCTFKLLASFLEFFAGVPLSPLKQWPSMVEDQLVSAAISNNLKMVGESVVIRIWAMLKCLVSQSQKSQSPDDDGELCISDFTTTVFAAQNHFLKEPTNKILEKNFKPLA